MSGNWLARFARIKLRGNSAICIIDIPQCKSETKGARTICSATVCVSLINLVNNLELK